MKNLYERLKPQAMTVIDKYSREYPHTIEAIREDLKSNYSLFHMQYNTAMKLTDILDNTRTIDYLQLSDHFETIEL